MDPLQRFLSFLLPSRADSPEPPAKPPHRDQSNPFETPRTTEPRSRLYSRAELLQSHNLPSSASSSNLLATDTPRATVINASASTSNLHASRKSLNGKPSRKKRPGILAQGKFTITAETPPDDIIDYFEEVSNLTDYTSELDHGQPPELSRSGGAADVYRVATVYGTHVAVKCIYVQNTVSDSKVIKRSARELEVWSTLRHKNILPLLGLAKYQGRLAMVSNWMSSGSIVDYVKDKPDEVRYVLSHQVIEAVAYLHAREIVHGDLKGENVLISDDGVPMLTDFGLTMMAESNLILSATNAGGGTLRFMAPELFSLNGCRSKEADVYALGMTILQTLTGKQPFAEIQATPVVISMVIGQHQTPQRPDCLMPPSPLKDGIWEVMMKCWAYEPARRTRVTEIEKLIAGVLQRKPTITTITSINDVLDYFERVVKLEDYTSRLRRNDPPILIGHGDMPAIYRVATTNGTYVAVKRANNHYGCRDVDVLQRSARELQIWSTMKHKNILPLVGLAEYDNELVTVSNGMCLGSVVPYIRVNPGENRYILSKQVVEAVAYLHSRDMIHGDIRGDNVLISNDGTPMLSGFDFATTGSRLAPQAIDSDSLSISGRLRWMAPELFSDGASLSKEADIYALGMTILEILTGELPFAEVKCTSTWKIVFLVGQEHKTPQRPACLIPPSQLNDAFWNVMTKCWTYEPTQRATVAEVARLIESALDQEELVGPAATAAELLTKR